jgi:hypothetical protein
MVVQCVSGSTAELGGEIHLFYLIVLLFAAHPFSIQAPFYSSVRCVTGLLLEVIKQESRIVLQI